MEFKYEFYTSLRYEWLAYIDKMNKGVDDNKWIIWAIEHKENVKFFDTSVEAGAHGYRPCKVCLPNLL
jgi:hypothetical protein